MKIRSRVILLLLAAICVALVVSSGVAFAAVINGNNGDNNLDGTRKADRIDGRGGNDTIQALSGSDRLIGGADHDILNGASGNDTYLFEDNWGTDALSADTSGRDTLDFSATTFVDVNLSPSGANNEAQAGANTLDFPSTVLIEDVKGGSGFNLLRGNGANNRLFGNDSSDSLYGGRGSDTLFGGAGHDYINGGSGNDALNAGEGDDRYDFGDGWGVDTIAADTSGSEALDFWSLNSAVTVNLEASALRNEAKSGANTLDFPSTLVVEDARGGGFDDTINGNASGNRIWGRSGDDTINGGLGADSVYGEDPFTGGITGDDTIDVADGMGDPGDTVDCGPGNDTVEVDVNIIILLDGSSQTIGLDNPPTNCETIVEVETPW
jgi:hypothetical protein